MSTGKTKKVRLAYGQEGLNVEVSADATVIEPKYLPGVGDEQAALTAALRKPINSPPLKQIAKPGQKAVIVHTDITRATPNDRILPPLLRELEEAGVKREDITLLNALGTHRVQTEEELRTMLGAEVVSNYQCLQHDANDDDNLVPVGKTSLGNEVRINRHFMAADLRILTGFIEPHFFAGFSGGPKGVLPAIAGAESVFSNHGAKMVGNPRATWGVTEGNPIWEEMLEAARLARPSFLLNVTLNRDHQITGVFAGDLLAAHQAGCEFVAAGAMVPVSEPFDIVITSNSGYPLDLNLYQSVKGMSAAAQVVRPGGSIIIAAQCWDGIPAHGQYARLLREAENPAELLARIESPGFQSADQWQVQMQAKIQAKADVYVYAEGLSDQQIVECLLKPCRSIEETLADLSTRNASRKPTICLLPDGPITIPYIKAP